MLNEQECDDEIVTTGLPHDTLEDTDVVLDDIKKLFGSRVAKLVEGASEVRDPAELYNGKESWKTRKEHTIQFLLGKATQDQLLVACADKLDNITSIQADYKRLGDVLWERFCRKRRTAVVLYGHYKCFYTKVQRNGRSLDPPIQSAFSKVKETFV